MALFQLGSNFVYEVSALAFTNVFTRFDLSTGEDIVTGGFFEDLAIHLTAIAGGAANFASLSLGWVNADDNYIVSKLSAQAWTLNADLASEGDFTININKKFGPLPASATGIWLGIDLDVGTATGRVELIGRTAR